MKVCKYYDQSFKIITGCIQVLLDYCPLGGLCHTVVSENNCTDEDLKCIIQYCNKKENENELEKSLSIFICQELLKIPYEKRLFLLNFLDYFEDQDIYLLENENCNEDCESCIYYRSKNDN